MNRRGFTLVQLIVGVVTSSVVMTGVFRTVLSTQRNSQALVQRIDVQQNVRVGAHYLSTVFRELDAADGDILSVSNSTLRFRSMRWVGILCGAPLQVGNDVLLPLYGSPFFGIEQPSAVMDSILIFRDGQTSTRLDDRWLPAGVQAVDPGVCTDGSVATSLRIGISAAEGGADSVVTGVTEGAPIRGFHIVELTTMVDGANRWWLGQRSANRSGAWTSVDPLLGPLVSSGFNLESYDGNNNVTTNPSAIASLALTLRGESMGRSGRAMKTLRDSVVTRVALRNNRKF